MRKVEGILIGRMMENFFIFEEAAVEMGDQCCDGREFCSGAAVQGFKSCKACVSKSNGQPPS